MSQRAVIEHYLTPVVAIYDTSANPGQSIPGATLTAINYDHKVLDTLNAVTFPGGAWAFTVPPTYKGQYDVTAALSIVGAANQLGILFLEASVNGTSMLRGVRMSYIGFGGINGVELNGPLILADGDVVKILVYQEEIGAPARLVESNKAIQNRVYIRKMNHI